MDGVFMFKLLKKMVSLALVLGVVYAFFVFKDRQMLNDQIVRLHVVADSDDPEDQAVKLAVRDAVLEQMESLQAGAISKEEVMQLLQDNLPMLKEAADRVLEQCGSVAKAVVTLGKEAFPTRFYDTFSLPAGVYDSLRITIGEGEGQNWWCVVFPELCIPAASEGVQDTAAAAGFSDPLGKALTGTPGFELRFWVLDCIGKIQNYLFMG